MVSGWFPVAGVDGRPLPALSPWFYYVLDQARAPWAFEKGLPYRTISALELLGSTIAVMLNPECVTPGAVNSLLFLGDTDSGVSCSAVSRGLSTSYPLCLVAMELSAQLESRAALLRLSW